MKKLKTTIKKTQLFFIYILPIAVYFPYHPLITVGENETMNLELSILLVWLILFCLISFPVDIKWFLNDYKSLNKKEKLISLSSLAVAGYFTLSTLWSPNKLRAILTSGVLCCVFFSVISIYIFLKQNKQEQIKTNFLKIFFAASSIICVWCWVQCLIDIISQSSTDIFLCSGCKTITFGFPHPNGFAAEPQYMGSLLIIPALMSLYFIIRPIKAIKKKQNIIYTILFVSTLFLTLSRGAIYAFGAGYLFLSILFFIKNKKQIKNILLPTCLVIGSFILTLLFQGLFAELSYTNDTFLSGIDKSLNQLSLGIIKIRQSDPDNDAKIEGDNNENEISSIHDGYIEASTNERLTLSSASLALISTNPNFLIFGTGMGGAGTALNEALKNGLYSEEFLGRDYIDRGALSSPKKNIQNQYVEILLEFGIIGFILSAIACIIIIISLKEQKHFILYISIICSYGISFFFFSGLPNVLHIYMLVPILPLVIPRKTDH